MYDDLTISWSATTPPGRAYTAIPQPIRFAQLQTGCCPLHESPAREQSSELDPISKIVIRRRGEDWRCDVACHGTGMRLHSLLVRRNGVEKEAFCRIHHNAVCNELQCKRWVCQGAKEHAVQIKINPAKITIQIVNRYREACRRTPQECNA